MMKYLAVLCFTITIVSCQSQPSLTEKKISNTEMIAIADSISKLMSSYHFNPAELNKEEYLKLERRVFDQAKKAKSGEEFIDGFNELWKDGPFSHVSLQFSNMKATDMADYFDTLRVGDQSVALEWQDKTAILTVRTMMGIDTYERIFEAYNEISKKGAQSLIIDVRDNQGGAFAIVPLVGYVFAESLDVGMFVSRKWWNDNDDAPELHLIQNTEPWEGWSLKTFWHDVQTNPVTRVMFKPMNPRFDGPVYVLVNRKSASATEFAVDALANLENVTIIGETTAGDMLSQKMFDLPHGFQLSLPIAEYYSTRIGKIEGKGVEPDISIDPGVAKELAMFLIQGDSLENAVTKAKLAIRAKDEPTFGSEKIYLFGNMNNWGKEWDKTPQLTYNGEGIYQTSTTLKPGQYEFKIAPMNWSFDFGATEENRKVSLDQETSLVKIPGSANLELVVQRESELTFTLDVSNENHEVLVVTEP